MLTLASEGWHMCTKDRMKNCASENNNKANKKQATVEHSLWPGAMCSQFNKPSGWLKHVTLMLKDQELTDQGYF